MEKDQLHKTVIEPVIYIKKKQLYKMRKENQEMIRDNALAGLPYDDLIEREKTLLAITSEINKYTNTVIQR